MDTQAIEKMITSSPVVVFGKGLKHQPYCGFTASMQEIFDEIFPEYEMINVLGNKELRDDMKEFSNWPTFPQIYIHGEFIGGGDIIKEMHEEGELCELIDKK